MQTRPLPETADARSPAGGGDPLLDWGHNRRHDPFHRPARAGEPGDRPCHSERVLARPVRPGGIWRRDESGEEVTVLTPGVSIEIPVGAGFQYRCTGAEALRFLCITMPPWPGDAEATQIEGPWMPTAPVDPVSSATAL
jgi:hypothetical protein